MQPPRKPLVFKERIQDVRTEYPDIQTFRAVRHDTQKNVTSTPRGKR